MVKDNLLKQDSDLAKKMKDVTRRLIALEQRMNKDSSIQEGPDGADDDTQPLPILPGYRYRYPRIVNDPARKFPDSQSTAGSQTSQPADFFKMDNLDTGSL